MKQVLTGTCLAAAFAVGLSAQTPQTPPTAQSATSPQTAAQDSRDAAKDAAKTITVSGCLKPGEGSDTFILSDLKWGGSSSSAVGTSGTAGAAATSAPASIGAATQLSLKAKGDAKLSEHVGHQVEVTGSVSDKSSSAPSTASPADPAAPRPSASAGASGPTFEARTVKMIAATCSM